MQQVTEYEIENRLRLDNPWWKAGEGIDPVVAQYPRRAYLAEFRRLIQQTDVRRAVVLLGPRRVGKTVLVYHTIHDLIQRHGVNGHDILYVSLETPIYTGLTLESLVRRFQRLHPRPEESRPYVFFDEIQYFKNWEIHLKSLVDTFRDVRFVATGSAAAALRTKSIESGAGRFTEFSLPPLTFAEYLRFIGREDELIRRESAGTKDVPGYDAISILELNDEFIQYLNFGGYPEVVYSKDARANPRRFIKSDIIDKVLLRDLPSLYGIQDIQELNSLFNTLAYNTGNEMSLGELAKSANVAKNTLSRYVEYLEAAFLIKHIKRVDSDAAHFKRVTTFKTYLTNPTMRTALFSPLDEGHEAIGQLAETAVFSQWLHNVAYIDSLYYARWKNGEVDLVSLDPQQRPVFAIEVKWSDRVVEDKKGIKGLLEFAKRHKLARNPLVTTHTISVNKRVDGVDIDFVPCSLHCYTVGKNTLERPDSCRATA